MVPIDALIAAKNERTAPCASAKACFVLTACLFVLAQVLETSLGAEETVPVGVAKIDITPGYPVRMYGYASRTTESEGIAGRLTAKALVLGDNSGDGPAVLLTVDCGSVPPDLRDEVYHALQATLPLQPARFMLANSHTHAGPNLMGMESIAGDQKQRLVQYRKEMRGRLIQVVQQAAANRTPGRLAWTQGSVGFAANRRVLKNGKWTGFGAVLDAPVDHSLPLLRVTDASGKLLAVVVNYACHNTTLRGNFRQLHGDWAGCAQQYIEADHSGALAMICIGCGADADPHPHGTVELCQQHGRALADEVKRLLQGPMTPIAPRLSARKERLEVPYLQPPPVEQVKARVGRSWALQRWLDRVQKGQPVPKSRDLWIATWTFGDDLAMVFLSDEMVVDYALRLKRELDAERLWITAYCHEVSIYVASKRLLSEGGYEVRNSLSNLISYGQPELVEPTIEQRIISQVRKMLPAGFHAKSRPMP